MPLQPMWSKDAPTFHRSWATTWLTPWRACRPTPWSATRRRYFLTHISSNLLLLLGRRGHLVNLAAHQVEPAERAPRERTTQRRPKAGAKRQWLLQETTRTLSRTDNHYHCESCHATVSQDRLNAWLQQGPCPAMLLDAPFPVAIGRGSLHESHTLTFLDDRRTWLCTACGHISRLRAHVSFPRRAGAT